MRRVVETFLAFLGLGLTSFGGPVAHLGYFHAEFVIRRRWLSEADYADLVALCQAIPGPASSQVGIAIGYGRAGFAGAVAAFVGFTLPSVVVLYAVSLGAGLWSTVLAQGILHGLKLAALAVVALAVWQMASKLTPDWGRRLVAALVAALILLVPLQAMPVVAMGLAALAGGLLPGRPVPVAVDAEPLERQHSVPRFAAVLLIAFALLLVLLPALSAMTQNSTVGLVDRFYRTGALVFGGGHVVLPLLETELVATGLIDRDLFLACYGAAQAVPGPLFSFAFYAGALLHTAPNGIGGGLLALAAIYLPSFLLVLGVLPYWERLRTIPRLRATLDLVNAAVVGLLVAALVDPVFTSSVFGPLDVVFAGLAFVALHLRVWPWAVVLACGAAGALLTLT